MCVTAAGTMAVEMKSVKLERQTTASNPNGTFGFSVLGGSGTKFPAVVCEIDGGGPADLCGKARVCTNNYYYSSMCCIMKKKQTEMYYIIICTSVPPKEVGIGL